MTETRKRSCLLTGGGHPDRGDAPGGRRRALVESRPAAGTSAATAPGRFPFDLLTGTDREPPGTPADPLPPPVTSVRAVALDRPGSGSGSGSAHRNRTGSPRCNRTGSPRCNRTGSARRNRTASGADPAGAPRAGAFGVALTAPVPRADGPATARRSRREDS